LAITGAATVVTAKLTQTAGAKFTQVLEKQAAAQIEVKAIERAKIESNARRDDNDLYGEYRKPDGSWDWQKHAPNGGAVPGTRQTGAVKIGDTLDRYGFRGGEYMSPANTPLAARSLPPGKIADPYEQYPVLKPFKVVKEEIAPAFGQPGGGIQLRAQIPEVQNRFATIDDLIQFGYLKDPKGMP
jgi:hypothetical protein